MSWSLQLRNGDLAHDRGRYAVVQGPNKIAQDLRVWILTRYGADEAHPTFGSTIDGGVEGDQELASVLDLNNPNIAATVIRAELQRWATGYKQQQLARIQSDVQTYGSSSLRKDEILEDLSEITFSQVQDTLFVQVTIKPAVAQEVTLNVPVITNG